MAERTPKWFERHGLRPVTEIPHIGPKRIASWSSDESQLIETKKDIGLIEKPEYKRRWDD